MIKILKFSHLGYTIIKIKIKIMSDFHSWTSFICHIYRIVSCAVLTWNNENYHKIISFFQHD